MDAWETISLPFTAPQDGFFQIFLNPSTTAPASLLCSTNGSTTPPRLIRVNSFSGYAEAKIYPIKAGDTIAVYMSDGSFTTIYGFRSIY